MGRGGLRDAVRGVVQIDKSGAVTVQDAKRLRGGVAEEIARHAIFADKPEVRDVQLRLAEIERDLEEKNAQWEAMI